MDGIAAIEARVAEITRRFAAPVQPAAVTGNSPGDFAAHLRHAMGTAAASTSIGFPGTAGAVSFIDGRALFGAPAPGGARAGIGVALGAGRGGSIDNWTAEAIRVTGVPDSWAPALRTIAEKESSLDPAAVNLGAVGGNRAKAPTGLMQTIPSTFAAHAAPGHGDILDPVDNMVAAIRYIRSRYGDPSATPGLRALARGERYVGY